MSLVILDYSYVTTSEILKLKNARALQGKTLRVAREGHGLKCQLPIDVPSCMPVKPVYERIKGKRMGLCMCSIFFASGLNTLLQTTWGDRLPIVQGGSFSFLTPAFAIIANVAARGDFGCAPDAPVCDGRFKVRYQSATWHLAPAR
jgi:hypothetical protein